MFAGKKSAQIREILINESAWEEMTCLFAPSLIRRFGLSSEIKPKSLIKTFYELRRGRAETFKYIPNFDNLHISQKRELVSMWIGKEKEKKLSNSEIERKFKFKIAKSVKELEEDISGIS